MKSSFGNYVVQKALEVASVQNKKKLVETILFHIEKLNEKKLMNKWKKIVNDSLGKSNKNQQLLSKFNNFKMPKNKNTKLVYFSINYDGYFKFYPQHKLDRDILELFNDDQKSKKNNKTN